MHVLDTSAPARKILPEARRTCKIKPMRAAVRSIATSIAERIRMVTASPRGRMESNRM